MEALTAKGRKIGRPSKYPFRTMAVGDRFPVPVNAQQSVRQLAWRMGTALDRKFSVIKTNDGLFECIRVA